MHGKAVMIYTPKGVMICQTSLRFGLDKKQSKAVRFRLFLVDIRGFSSCFSQGNPFSLSNALLEAAGSR